MTFALDDPMEKGECSGKIGAQKTTKLHYNQSPDLKRSGIYDDDDDDEDDDYDPFEGNAGSGVSQRRKDT